MKNECGMHYVKNLFNVFGYYPMVNDDGELNEFAEVEPLDEQITDDGEKFCVKKLKVGEKSGLKGIPDARITLSGFGVKINSSGEDSVVMCGGI